MKKISPKLQKILNSGKFFTVDFIKRTDGTKRTMNARRGVKVGLKGGKLKFSLEEKNLLSVYDIPNKHAKTIPIDGIIEIRAKGKKFK